MYNLGIILAILCLGVANVANFSFATNYCDPELCQPGRKHIGCKHNHQFARVCEDASLIDIPPEFQVEMVNTHNDCRNKLALGRVKGFQSAKRMTTLTWDDELAYLAKLNVLQCKMEHDGCHNTPAYRYSGQNLGWEGHTLKIDSLEQKKIILRLIIAWFDEYKYATQADMDKFISKARPKEEQIGHFTAMMQDKSSKVGCAASAYKAYHTDGKKYNMVLLACNYSYTNIISMPVYAKGPTASACKTGRNPDYHGLCSVNEDVAPSPFDDDPPKNLPSVATPKPRFTQQTNIRLTKDVAPSPFDDNPPKKLPSVTKTKPRFTQQTIIHLTVPDETVKPTPSNKSVLNRLKQVEPKKSIPDATVKPTSSNKYVLDRFKQVEPKKSVTGATVKPTPSNKCVLDRFKQMEPKKSETNKLNVPSQTIPKRVKSETMLRNMEIIGKHVQKFDVGQVPGHFCPKDPPPKRIAKPATECPRRVPSDFKYVPGEYKPAPDIVKSQLVVPVQRDASGRPLRGTVSPNLQKLIDTAAPVVRPKDEVRDNPDNFYIPIVRNPEVSAFNPIRPVPSINWTKNKNPTTAPVKTSAVVGKRPVAPKVVNRIAWPFTTITRP